MNWWSGRRGVPRIGRNDLPFSLENHQPHHCITWPIFGNAETELCHPFMGVFKLYLFYRYDFRCIDVAQTRLLQADSRRTDGRLLTYNR